MTSRQKRQDRIHRDTRSRENTFWDYTPEDRNQGMDTVLLGTPEDSWRNTDEQRIARALKNVLDDRLSVNKGEDPPDIDLAGRVGIEVTGPEWPSDENGAIPIGDHLRRVLSKKRTNLKKSFREWVHHRDARESKYGEHWIAVTIPMISTWMTGEAMRKEKESNVFAVHTQNSLEYEVRKFTDQSSLLSPRVSRILLLMKTELPTSCPLYVYNTHALTDSCLSIPEFGEEPQTSVIIPEALQFYGLSISRREYDSHHTIETKTLIC